MTLANGRSAQISASILNADFAALGAEVQRADRGGVDSIHLDVMDGHFVPNLTIGPVVVEAIRDTTALAFHSHLMISEPLRYVEAFANAGGDLIVFHVETGDSPPAVIEAIHRSGRAAGLALNPETEGAAVLPFLELIDLLLVMTVHPGFGGQPFMHEVLPKLRSLRTEAERRGLDLPIAVDGGVNLETIGPAYAAGGDVMVVGSALYQHPGDLRPIVDELRSVARRGADVRMAAPAGEGGA
ncbi:MAG: ribulose-phosphate 3-epimerase [Chloroflexota bacterium]|nr:ribulose-phosphate 3-epimerase [Chloroflexota bacterium]